VGTWGRGCAMMTLMMMMVDATDGVLVDALRSSSLSALHSCRLYLVYAPGFCMVAVETGSSTALALRSHCQEPATHLVPE
jgi:hypothetical protein